MKRFLQKLLGVDDLKIRLDRLERERPNLELRVIESRVAMDSIREATQTGQLTDHLRKYLEDLGLKLNKATELEVQKTLNVAGILEGCNFIRFLPPETGPYTTPIITLRDLMEHPERYLHKLPDGFLKFPIGMDFKSINEVLNNLNLKAITFNSAGHTTISPFSLGLSVENAELFGRALREAEIIKGSSLSIGYEMNPLNFLLNSDGLEKYVVEYSKLDAERKTSAIFAIRSAKLVYGIALEIMAGTRIMDTRKILEPQLLRALGPDTIEPQDQLKLELRNALLKHPTGTSHREIQQLIEIRSIDRFRKLAAERTEEILRRDEQYWGLMSNRSKPIEEYNVGESLILACYFASSIITKYESLEESVRVVINGEDDGRIKGDTKTIMGLALQYLRQYLIPLNSERFDGWTFGYSTPESGGSRSLLMKAINVKPDGTTDVYFLDPTLLSVRGLEGLNNPESILKYIATHNHPITIVREAEDLLTRNR